MSKNGGNIGLFNIKLPISTLPKQWNAWALESYHVEVHTASDKQKMHNHVTEYALDKEKQIKMYQEPRKNVIMFALNIWEANKPGQKKKGIVCQTSHILVLYNTAEPLFVEQPGMTYICQWNVQIC